MDDISELESFSPQEDETSNDEKLTLSMSYDSFAKWLFSRLFFARAFFKRFLPAHILDEVDLETLELITSQFVNEEGKTSLSDICYQVKLKKGGRKTLIILLEHKSSADRGAALQMARYDLDLLDLMFKNPEHFADSEGKIPSPYPFLFCQEPCPIFDAVVSRVHPSDRYGMSFEYQSVNVNEIDLDALRDIVCLFASFSLFRLSKDPIRKNWEKLREKLCEPFDTIVDDYLDTKDQERYRGFLTGFLSFASFFIRSNAKIEQFIDDLRRLEREKYKGDEEKLMSVEMFLDQEIASPFHQITVMSQSLDEMRKAARQKDEKILEQDKQLSQKNEQLSQTREQLSQKEEKILEQGRQLSQKDKQLSQKDEQLSQKDEQLSQTREQLSQKDEQLSKLEGESIELLQDSIVSVLQSRFPNELTQSVYNCVQSIKEKTSLKKIFQFSLKDALPTISTKLDLICSGF